MEIKLSELLKDPEGFTITNDKGEAILSIDGYYMDEDNKSNHHGESMDSPWYTSTPNTRKSPR